MKRLLLIAGVAVLGVSITAGMASAQCAFQHPAKAKETKTSFVQAFVSCGNVGGNTPNTETQTGVPACKPVESYQGQAGNPGNGWTWGPGPKGKLGEATVSFKSAKNKLVGPLNPIPNTADIAVQVKGKGISDAAGLVEGAGTLSTLSRATIEDRAAGDMTLIDFAVPFALPVTGGKISLKSSANAVLNTTFGTSLPGCTSVEVVSFQILDENGTIFGTTGVFLPDINPN